MRLLESYLQYLQYERKAAPNTLLAYRSDLEQCARFCLATFEIDILESSEGLSGLTGRIIRLWLAKLAEAGAARATLSRKMTALRRFIRYQLKQGELQTDPIPTFRLPRGPKRLPGFIPKEQMTQFWRQAPEPQSLAEARDLCIMELFYGCGLRRMELIGLNGEDVDYAGKQLRVLGKGKKERLIPFGQAVEAALETYLHFRTEAGFGETEALLLTEKGKRIYGGLVYQIVRRQLGPMKDLARKHPHLLRHTYATHLVDEGADLNSVKELLGHRSLSATSVYVHNSTKKLKALYNKTHPRA